MISQEAQADTCALKSEVVVIEKQIILVYNLETTREEEALSSLIIQSDSACPTYLIWLRVGAATVERVLIRNKVVSLAQRAWIRCWAAHVSGASVLRLYIMI